MTPVTADLRQDQELRRLIKVWEEARDKESDPILQLPDPVPVKVPESTVKVSETGSSAQESRSPPESESAPSVKSDFVEASNNADSDNNEDDITFEGIFKFNCRKKICCFWAFWAGLRLSCKFGRYELTEFRCKHFD